MVRLFLILGICAAVFGMLGFGAFNFSDAPYALAFRILTGIFIAAILIAGVATMFRSVE